MHNRFFKIVALVLVVMMLSLSLQGCYGKFQLSKKLYTWNGQVGDKFINSLVMWVLVGAQVYSALGFVDFVILNVIEFWTGTNPVAMGPGDSETQIVQMDGTDYEIVATQNRFDIRSLSNEEPKSIALVFNDQTNAWYVENEENGSLKIAQLDEQNSRILQLIDPEGNTVSVDLTNDMIIE